MAEKKGIGHAYNIDFLNVVFAASSIFLFLSTIWMVWDDYDREWKNVQRQFVNLEVQVTQAGIEKAQRSVDANKLAELQTSLAEAQKNVSANQQKVSELQDQIRALEARLYRESQAAQFAKATFDHDRYEFETARVAGSPNAARMGESVAAQEKQLVELNQIVERTTAERGALRQQLEQITGALGTTQKQIDELRAEEIRLQKRLAVIQPSVLKNYFRDAPLLDFMAPTIRIQQILLPNILDDVNFTKVAKMDRCTTCHLAIDRTDPLYEKYPQPYKPHPNLDTYLTSASKHPMDQIGCTVCHEGMGQSVSFRDVSHTPGGATEEEREAKRAHWEEEFDWEEPHLWDYPMLPTGMTEASCAKCHKREVYVPKAEKLNVAYATYERAGCYACHKTRGFEDVKKPGPILTKIGSKLTQDWVKTWIRNPRAVKPTTWMPRVWYNSNSSAPEDATRNEVEISAAVAYLFANSAPYEPAVKSPPRGDAKRGEEIVKSIGCLGCHALDEKARVEAGPRRTFGQPLQNVGNKTTYEWIFNWVRDPKHYSPATYMPDLRLTDPQVADVATYLSGLKGAAGDAAKATPDQAAVDATLLGYYYPNLMPFEAAKAAVSKLDAAGKQVELGRLVINRYGCYSCHEIKGFETVQPIGTELSEEGSKLVTRLDFAFVEDIPHSSKIEWFRTKLHDPRIFDRGRLLQPLDKLRMPNFDFSNEEIDRLLTAIMSFQREIQPAQAMPVKSARYDNLVQGRTMVHRRNCVGCHIIEGDGGDFLKLLSDPSMGPPTLTPEGARVQSEWLYAFLRGPITIRPWINVRMPTFGLDDANLNGVIRYFGAISNSIGPFQRPEIVRASATEAAGKQLFEQLQCQKCHVLGSVPKDQEPTTLAPDLRMASERLQPEWIVDWLKSPLTILPGTRMPVFWPDYPKSYYPHLGGSAEAQMRAIRDYLLTLRGGPSPLRPGAATTN